MLTTVTRYKGRDVTRNIARPEIWKATSHSNSKEFLHYLLNKICDKVDSNKTDKNYNKFLHYKNHYKVLQTLLQFSISISNCRKGRVIISSTRAYKLSLF